MVLPVLVRVPLNRLLPAVQLNVPVRLRLELGVPAPVGVLRLTVCVLAVENAIVRVLKFAFAVMVAVVKKAVPVGSTKKPFASPLKLPVPVVGTAAPGVAAPTENTPASNEVELLRR